MLGPETVARALAAFLSANVAAQIDLLAAGLGDLADGSDASDTKARALLVPQLVSSSPPPADTVEADLWPWLAVEAPRVLGIKWVDEHDPPTPPDGLDVLAREFEVRYAVRVYGWVRADGWELTRAVQQRLGLAVRQVLLSGCAPAPGLNVVYQGPWGEDYSPVGTDETLGGTVAVFAFDLQVDALERLGLPEIAPVSQVTVTVGPFDTP